MTILDENGRLVKSDPAVRKQKVNRQQGFLDTHSDISEPIGFFIGMLVCIVLFFFILAVFQNG